MPRFCESNQAPRIFFSGCLALLLLTAGCQQAQPDTRAADESAIKDLEVQWSKAAGTNNADQVVAYYSDDVVMLAPNAPIINGKAAARTAWAQFMALPGFSLSWESTKVELFS